MRGRVLHRPATIVIHRVTLIISLLYTVCSHRTLALVFIGTPPCTYYYPIKTRNGYNTVNNGYDIRVNTGRRYRSSFVRVSISYLTKHPQQHQTSPQNGDEDDDDDEEEDNRNTGTRGKMDAIYYNEHNEEIYDLIKSTKATKTTKATTTKSISISDSSTSSYSVTVLSNGKECQINVYVNETILTALERQSIQLLSTLDINELPSDCRRGNCLTCVATRVRAVAAGKQQNDDELRRPAVVAYDEYDSTTTSTGSTTQSTIVDPLVHGEDGLSPYISDRLDNAGYVLTCSSTVVGDGLILQLQQNTNVWNDIYQKRLSDIEMNVASRTCMARVIRKADERNIQRWAIETEAAFQKSSSSSLSPEDEAL